MPLTISPSNYNKNKNILYYSDSLKIWQFKEIAISQLLYLVLLTISNKNELGEQLNLL